MLKVAPRLVQVAEIGRGGIEVDMKLFIFRLICSGLILVGAGETSVWAGPEQFPTPQDAVKSLAAAAKAGDHAAMEKIFGPELHELVSADPVQASNRFTIFARRISEKADLVAKSDDMMTLDIGYDRWPFPIPLAKREGAWIFDTAAGREEILTRRIGANELGAIDVCRTYVEAQHEYAATDHSGDGVLKYARYLRSNPGKKDGLYWHADEGEEMSPFGPLVSEARGEGYHRTTKILNGENSPYHGYYFRILTRQGKHAAGGKYDYLINGRMVAGFALIAWPARWDNSGIMTFMVNQDGRVYEKNLGPQTERRANEVSAFDPDPTWRLVKEP